MENVDSSALKPRMTATMETDDMVNFVDRTPREPLFNLYTSRPNADRMPSDIDDGTYRWSREAALERRPVGPDVYSSADLSLTQSVSMSSSGRGTSMYSSSRGSAGSISGSQSWYNSGTDQDTRWEWEQEEEADDCTQSTALVPYVTEMTLPDVSGGCIEPLFVLQKVLSYMHSREVANAHGMMHKRIRGQFSRHQRRRLLAALNKIQFFDINSVEYARGCLWCSEYDASAEHNRYPLARILYSLCLNGDFHTARLRNRFILMSRCQTPNCVNPVHYTHSLRHAFLFETRQLDVDEKTPAPVLPTQLVLDRLFAEPMTASAN